MCRSIYKSQSHYIYGRRYIYTNVIVDTVAEMYEALFVPKLDFFLYLKIDDDIYNIDLDIYITTMTYIA